MKKKITADVDADSLRPVTQLDRKEEREGGSKRLLERGRGEGREEKHTPGVAVPSVCQLKKEPESYR